MTEKLTTKLVPTDEQQAVIDQARAGESLMLQAYAGCAKSSTLEMFARRVNVPSLALAFNKRIADELRPRLPGTFEVKTLNGLGHGAWARARSAGSLTLDDRKQGKLVTEISRRQGARLSPAQWDQARGLVAAAMQAGITPGDEGEPLASDCEETWLGLALDRGISSDDFPLAYSVAREVLVESIAQARAGIISFDDQVYCPTLLGGVWPRFPLVAVDESQDLSPLNHEMLRRVAAGRIVAVGDSRQAIYAWRGADAASMENLRKLRADDSWIDLPLRMTFRCPKLIVARQQGHAPGMQASPGNRDGRFERTARLEESPDEQTTGGWSWSWLDQQSQGGTIAVICRNNAPLLSLAFKLIRQSIGVVMPGRDLSKGLTQLVRKLAPADVPIAKLLAKLAEWEGREVENLVASGREHLVEGLLDRAECVRAVCDASEARTRDDLLAAVEMIFSRERGRVQLMSGHKSKGLEFDCVVHLDAWRIPSKWAKASAAAGSPAALEQEQNLRYVIETRTKDLLVNANLGDFR